MTPFTKVKQVSGSDVMDLKARPAAGGRKSAEFGGVVNRMIAQDRGHQEESNAADNAAREDNHAQAMGPAGTPAKAASQKAAASKARPDAGNAKAAAKKADAVTDEPSDGSVPSGPVDETSQPTDMKDLPVQNSVDGTGKQPAVDDTAVIDPTLMVTAVAVPLVEVKNAGAAVQLTVTESSGTGDESGAELPATGGSSNASVVTTVGGDAVKAAGREPTVATPAGHVQRQKAADSKTSMASSVKTVSSESAADVKPVLAKVTDTTQLSDVASTVASLTPATPAVAADAKAANGAVPASRNEDDSAAVSVGVAQTAVPVKSDDNNGSHGTGDKTGENAKGEQGRTSKGAENVIRSESRRNVGADPVTAADANQVQPVAGASVMPVDPLMQGVMSATGLSAREVDKFVLNVKSKGGADAEGDVLTASVSATKESRAAAESSVDQAPAMVDHMMKRVASLQDVVDKFDKMLLSLTSGRDTGMIVHLVPPNLGKLTINCKESGSDMSISIVADTSFARGFLQNSEQAIREVAANSGFKLSDFDVSTRSEDGNQRRYTGESEASEGRQVRKVAGKEGSASIAGANEENWQETNRNGGLWFVA